MKEKHLKARIAMCLELAKLSNCPRRKFGALLVEPTRNQVIGEGYNGGPRGGGKLCGGQECLRDIQDIVSGTCVEIGCHHAEMNVVCNCAASNISARDSWLFITGEPCLMCAKLIHHAGISNVIVVGGGYIGANGMRYLTKHGVVIRIVDGPSDPRLNKVVNHEIA